MKKKLLLFMSCFALGQGTIKAQEDKKVSAFNNFYMGAEVGASKGYRNFVQGGAWVQYDHQYFKIFAATAYDPATAEQKRLHKNHDQNCSCIEKRELGDISLIYGKSYPFFKVCQVQFGAGLAYVSKTEKDEAFNSQKHEFEPERYQKRGTIGLPAELRLVVQFKRYVSISCSTHVNANPIQSFRGMSAGLAIGMF